MVAVAKDTARQRQFVRRVELNQETFARFAYFSDTENGICFGSNDRLNGPVFSNDVIHDLRRAAKGRLHGLGVDAADVRQWRSGARYAL